MHIGQQTVTGRWTREAYTMLSEFGSCSWQNVIHSVSRPQHVSADHSVRKFSDSTAIRSHWSQPHNKYSLQYLYWNRQEYD